jgi:hypothetical protein
MLASKRESFNLDYELPCKGAIAREAKPIGICIEQIGDRCLELILSR